MPPSKRMSNLLNILAAQKQRSQPNSNLKMKLRSIHRNLRSTYGSNNRADMLRFSKALRNLNSLINSI